MRKRWLPTYLPFLTFRAGWLAGWLARTEGRKDDWRRPLRRVTLRSRGRGVEDEHVGTWRAENSLSDIASPITSESEGCLVEPAAGKSGPLSHFLCRRARKEDRKESQKKIYQRGGKG
jgi:hypothetical protein